MQSVDLLGHLTPIAAVVVICVLIGMFLKWKFDGDKRATASIPWILALCGGFLGLAAKMIIPEDNALDYLTAFAMGIISGMASGGAYQIIHQYDKLKKDD